MKVFMQRWWVANRLHKFSIIKGADLGPVVWVDENEFIRYCRNLVTTQHTDAGPMLPLKPLYKYITELPHDLTLDSVLRNLIDECSDPADGINYLVRERATRNQTDYHLRLSARGRDVYPLSYLFFRTEYSRKIWTAVIAGLVIWYASWRIEHAFPDTPQKIQVEVTQTTKESVVITPDIKG